MLIEPDEQLELHWKRAFLGRTVGIAACVGALASGAIVFALAVWPRPLAGPKNLVLVAMGEIDLLERAVRGHAEQNGGRRPETLDEFFPGEAPPDPWGRPWLYSPEDGKVWSLGADGLPGGIKQNQDVRSR